MKVTKHTIIAALMIFLAILIGHTTETGFSIGDKIFLGLGISPWTNGQTGFHYPFIIFSVLIIIGCIEARRAMTRLQLIVLILLLFSLTPQVVSLIKPLYFSMHSGLDAVEYDSRNSHFDVTTSADKKNEEIIGTVTLTNYGKNPIRFGIKIPSNNVVFHDCFSQDLVLTGFENLEEPDMFRIFPGQRKAILSYTTLPLQNDNYGMGTMSGPDLILFTNTESRVVGNNL